MGADESEQPVPVGEECIRIECHEFGSSPRTAPRDAKPKVVDMGYSDFELRVNDTVFKTHRHQLVKFGSFAKCIRHTSPKPTGAGLLGLKFEGDEQDVEDMVNAFKILYASVISGPSEFEPSVLISAFRVAKTYDYPDLYTYCIERLEECAEDLSPMQRIELARAFDPNSREVATYDAMCKRDKPFTEAEARILGMLAIAMVGRMRKLEKAKEDLTAKGVHTHEYEALEAWGREEPSITRGASECGRKRGEVTSEREERAVDDLEKKRRGKEVREETEMETEERKREYEGTSKQHQKRRERDGKGRRVSERKNKEVGEREAATRERIEGREDAAQSSRVDAAISKKERAGKKEIERREMEKKEMEERERGYEEALKQHQKRKKWEGYTKGMKEMGMREMGAGMGMGIRETGDQSPFSALLAHHRAMARLGSGSPDSAMDTSKLDEAHGHGAGGDSTSFDCDRPDDS